MARRFGWGRNGGTSLGDVRHALQGRSFGDAETVPALNTSAAGWQPDLSQGENFYLAISKPAGGTFIVSTPVNGDAGSSFRLIFDAKNHTLPTITLGAAYLAPAAFTTTKNTKKVFRFVYDPTLAKWLQVDVAGNLV